jgi:DNA-binding NtrC family response regulator
MQLPTLDELSNVPESDAPSVKGTVLVIDDEASVLSLAEAVLEFENWNTIVSTEGEIGLAILKRNQSKIDCVLLDVVMPDLGAEEILARIAREGINVPIVLMSGYSDTQLDQYRRSDQVVSVIAKPFRTSELTNAVESAVDAGKSKIKRMA